MQCWPKRALGLGAGVGVGLGVGLAVAPAAEAQQVVARCGEGLGWLEAAV